MNRLVSGRIARVFCALAGVALCTVAYFRGNYLLGPSCGAVYVGITLGLLWLFVRSLRRDRARSRVRIAGLIAFSLAAGIAMAWPASINSDVQIVIRDRAIERTAKAEVAAVFASESRYSDFSVSTKYLKVTYVTLRGTLETRREFDELRARIRKECPAVTKCALYWDVRLRGPEQEINGADRDLFAPEEARSDGR